MGSLQGVPWAGGFEERAGRDQALVRGIPQAFPDEFGLGFSL